MGRQTFWIRRWPRGSRPASTLIRPHDEPPRLSRIWMPTSGLATKGTEHDDSLSKLVRAGFLRQAYPGFFHMLPLGHRVQRKIEALIETHMDQLGASKVDLSTMSSEALWQASGRLSNVKSEVFRLRDRRDTPFLLSPTHEEEITALAARSVSSYRDLPLRLYQISRKYRDEFRPRQGLLRAREFVMKDLYTFDSTLREAQATYAQVHAAYARIFSALKLPILVAEASSGDMGGDLSHEFHLPASIGDDSVACCDSCDYAANDEVATTKAMPASSHGEHVAVWRGISKDRTRLINAWFPTGDGEAEQRYSSSDVNLLQIKAAVPDVDTGISDAISHWAAALTETPANSKGPSAVQLINIVDSRIHPDVVDDISQGRSELLWPKGIPREASLPSSTVISSTADGRPLHLLRVRSGDACPRCETGTLRVQKALELGHTFHLSTRYTVPLSATVAIPPSAKLLETSGPPSTAADSMSSRHVPMEMGCHGIGVSRIIGAVAHHFADRKGLNWPPVIAPYKVVIVPGPRTAENDALQVYQALSSHGTTETTFIDAILDDRDTSLPWKLKDADAAGFPVIVVLGKAWADNRVCEVQCRRLATTQFVPLEQLASVTSRLLHELWQ